MKKRVMWCVLLCLTFVLLCGSALAAGDLKSEVSPVSGSSVSIVKGEKNGSDTYTITKTSGVKDGELYLVMIQAGTDASAKPTMPTAETVYYLNVEAASGSQFTLEAVPKEMGEGSYVVYLSDYSDGSGAAQGVGTIVVSGLGNKGDDDNNGDILYGDVNGDKEVDDVDEMVLARYNAGWDGYGEGLEHNMDMANADVNKDHEVDDVDEMILARYNAGWDGYSLPYEG